MSKVSTLKRVIREGGIRGVIVSILEKIAYFINKTIHLIGKKSNAKSQVNMIVKEKDVLAADWILNERSFKVLDKKDSYHINWVLHPGGASSGGTQNIFRFISYLESAGHTNSLYFYATRHFTLDEVISNTANNYVKIEADFNILDGPMKNCDAIFATGWETAYPAYNDPSNVQRFYFVQDFEPYFSPVGSEYTLAENTYKFGFHGLTAGKWLANKLSTEYSMKCDYYDFGVDLENYKYLNKVKRDKVFFYARPVTARRGFELGVWTLKEFKRENPDIEIIIAGWDLADYDLGFEFTNLSVQNIGALPAIYNECAAALLYSHTNMSLLPLELLACGVIPVMNDGENNRQVSDNDFIRYAPPTPHSMVEALNCVVRNENQVQNSEAAVQSVQGLTWDVSGRQFVESFERVMNE